LVGDVAREKGELIYILLCHWLVQAVGTSRPTVPGSDYVCLDINKLMYDLEHDDEPADLLQKDLSALKKNGKRSGK
jgi:hypothetical protein